MIEHGGIGFAANQMGFNYRVFAMNTNDTTRCYYNPEILVSSEEAQILFEEGCLSFPGLRLGIKRPKNIFVRYQDSQGIFHEEELTGIASRCYQHELDHLNGVCFVDRVSRMKLDMAKKKREKRERNK